MPEIQKTRGSDKQDTIYAMDAEALYHACLRGDMDAWKYVYGYVAKIVRSSRWYLSDRQALDDLAQEIVCHLLDKGLDKVQEPAAFKGYIRRVAINRILDGFRKKLVKTMSIDIDPGDDRPVIELVCPRPGPVTLTRQRCLLETINKAIDTLSEKCKSTLNGYIAYKRGDYQDYATLAGKLQVSVGTLSSRVNRCLAELRQISTVKYWLEA